MLDTVHASLCPHLFHSIFRIKKFFPRYIFVIYMFNLTVDTRLKRCLVEYGKEIATQMFRYFSFYNVNIIEGTNYLFMCLNIWCGGAFYFVQTIWWSIYMKPKKIKFKKKSFVQPQKMNRRYLTVLTIR